MDTHSPDGSGQRRLGGSGHAAIGALCYLPPLFLLPYVLRSPSGELRFHARQSIVLFLALTVFAFGVWLSDVVLGRVLGGLVLLGGYFSLLAKIVHYPVGLAVALLYIALVVGAAVQAAGGQTWRIPVVSGYADRLPFGS